MKKHSRAVRGLGLALVLFAAANHADRGGARALRQDRAETDDDADRQRRWNRAVLCCVRRKNLPRAASSIRDWAFRGQFVLGGLQAAANRKLLMAQVA